jgi:hypothetical protein
VTILCIPHAADLVRGGDGCTVCRLERELAEAKALLKVFPGRGLSGRDYPEWEARRCRLLEEVPR